MRKNWRNEGMACRTEGIRHDQLLLMRAVPNAAQEALRMERRGERDKRFLVSSNDVHDVTRVPEGIVQRR